ncbi:hypothetical protein EV138_6178 [Kribbella voronezhensis]|uniref:Uncharacterized protein n=1 Tax=Kribbella voronezhensis TaxID=2512212 RepID=A0A4R7SWT8_9ACTN|nr:hypothetical protein EV138_6178 [Kribbella voronezhensis]
MGEPPRRTGRISSQVWRSLLFTALGFAMTVAGLILSATGDGPVGLAIALLAFGSILVVAGAYRRQGERP